MSEGVHVGLELDGTHATVVTVHDGTVSDVKTVHGATPEDALDQVLASVRRADPVRAALVSEGVVVRRVDVTSADLTHAAFADLTYAATGAPREGTTTAALLFDVTGVQAGLLGSGAAAVAPADPVTRLYEVLAGRASEVVPAAFTAGVLEGVSLALRHTSADLTLVVDGDPVAHQQLSAGGLSVVEAVLGGGTEAGGARLRAALSGQGAADPIAVGALERYLREVLASTRDTLDAWARRGERVSTELYVYGPGARARSLDMLLSDARLTRVEHKDVSQALVHLPPNDRPAAVAAYLAAATYATNRPYAAFVSPGRIRELEHAERRRRTRRRVRTFTTSAALVAAGLVGPAAAGFAAERAADHRLEAAQNAVDATGRSGRSAADFTLLEQGYGQLAARGSWAEVLPAVEDAAPADVHVESISVQDRSGDLVVNVTGTADSRDVASTSDYMAALRGKMAVSEVIPTTIATTANGTRFALTFTLTGGAR